MFYLTVPVSVLPFLSVHPKEGILTEVKGPQDQVLSAWKTFHFIREVSVHHISFSSGESAIVQHLLLREWPNKIKKQNLRTHTKKFSRDNVQVVITSSYCLFCG